MVNVLFLPTALFALLNFGSHFCYHHGSTAASVQFEAVPVASFWTAFRKLPTAFVEKSQAVEMTKTAETFSSLSRAGPRP